MAEENQVTKEPQQVTQVTKELQRVTTKNPKRVEVGERLAEHNRKKREAKKREEQVKLEKSRVNQYYEMGWLCDPRPAGPIGAVMALGVIGGLGYYICRSKKGEQPSTHNKIILRCKHRPKSLRWIKSILYYKNVQEEYSKWFVSSGSYISSSSWLFHAGKENIKGVSS